MNLPASIKFLPRFMVFSFLIILSAFCLLLITGAGNGESDLDHALREKLTSAGVTQLEPFEAANPAQVNLGRFLFFDPILSGNRDTSCATCHHPSLATADALALSIGVGGQGLGVERVADSSRLRVPRNAPDLFNRGSEAWHTMFWDNRIALTEDGLLTPAGTDLVKGIDNILAAQALFPVTSREEMRGLEGDKDIFGHPNELALLADDDFTGIWDTLMQRLKGVPEYDALFQEAYPELAVNDVAIQHVANAIGAFEAAEWTLLDSPFDRYLAGETHAMTIDAKEGAVVFFGEAGCGSCHSGPLLTDQTPHNIGVPPLGPGKSGSEIDFGLELLTQNKDDRCAFRTPPLRNVALTGPWMHNGALTSLEDVIWQHLDPEAALRTYSVAQLEPALRSSVKRDVDLSNDLLAHIDPELRQARVLSAEKVSQLVAFLDSLTSPTALNLMDAVPAYVPSGLPFD